ncbi:MAG: phosphoribosylformylglycinamidine cyclo-ligase [Planctomycetota bacterium]|nr:phosphoribosylformylglycinamidine cyclo-ligase [Planctomycetota bacterium]MDA1164759.1 phosphoribosylformylglycinamidine cyclo-ligase [Planctomycetota bacterium]
MAELTYKDAGVDLDLYEQAMAKLPALMQKTHTPRVMPMPGGFAGLFQLGTNSRLFKKNYCDPVLVSGTDGVGTKLKVAIAAGKYDTVGIDLVGMCVNDCLCVGAEPLFFLDYLALGKDDPELISQLVEGVSSACCETGMALLGGETAIMPDVYQAGDFDMAGFSVGVVEKDQIIDGTRSIRPGDVLVGLGASGFHSNGYSLVRKVVTDVAGLSYDSHVADLNQSVADILLEPTRLYVKSVLSVLDDPALRVSVHGLAHITGGGLPDNIQRILPENCAADIDTSTWTRPPAFQWLQGLGGIARDEMYKVFNMGIGFVLIVEPAIADRVCQEIARHDIPGSVIGEIKAAPRTVALHHPTT